MRGAAHPAPAKGLCPLTLICTNLSPECPLPGSKKHPLHSIVQRVFVIFYAFSMKRTPSVFGPQWLETTHPARVSRISLKMPSSSR